MSLFVHHLATLPPCNQSKKLCSVGFCVLGSSASPVRPEAIPDAPPKPPGPRDPGGDAPDAPGEETPGGNPRIPQTPVFQVGGRHGKKRDFAVGVKSRQNQGIPPFPEHGRGF